MEKKNKKVSDSTFELMSIKNIEQNYVVTPNMEYIVFFEIQPFNVAVIGRDEVLNKISSLQGVLTGIGNMEILCLSSSQSYEKNKRYLKERSEDMTMHPSVREMAQLEAEYLDNISLTMSTSRDFYFVVRFKKNEFDIMEQKISQYSRLISDKDFSVKLVEKKYIKKSLAVYWEQNAYSVQFPDFDGEEFAQEEVYA